MTGRRLVDAAAIFTAARGVASKHVALRRHQLDVYSKTSTLAKALQSQSDRVTLTVKAAAALAERFNERGPQYSTQASQRSPSASTPDTSSHDGGEGSDKGIQRKEGLTQDHFYEKSNENTTAEAPPRDNLDIKQEKANQAPLPDGSIPPAGADLSGLKLDQDILYEVPKTEPLKEPLQEEKQNLDQKLQPAFSGQKNMSRPGTSTRPQSAEQAKKLQRQAEKKIPSQAAQPLPSSAVAPDGVVAADNESPSFNVNQEQEAFYTYSSSSSRVLSAVPRVKIPKNTEDSQQSDEHISDDQINQDVFYSSTSKDEQKAVPEAQAVPEQEPLSDEAYSEIFHSPRVAKMLGRQPRKDDAPDGLNLPGAKGTPVKDTKMPQESDQVSSGVRTPTLDEAASPKMSNSSPEPAASRGNDDDDVHVLAADMAKDADKMSSDSSEVSPLLTTLDHHADLLTAVS